MNKRCLKLILKINTTNKADMEHRQFVRPLANYTTVQETIQVLEGSAQVLLQQCLYLLDCP